MKMNSILLTVLIAIFIFASNSIFATTYYVSLTGDDTNDGSSASPFRTITYGATVLLSGDTLIVKDGDYGNENVIVSQSGTASSPIVVKAEHIGQAIINGPRLPSEWDSDCGFGIFIMNETLSVDYINISGFYIKNCGTGIYGEGNDGILLSHININNCTFENNTSDGIAFYKTDYVTIENCTFISGIPDGVTPPVTDDYVLQDYGVGLYYVNNSTLQNNYFFGTHAQAISYKYGCHNSLVKQNIFESVVSACIFIGQRCYDIQEYCSDITVEKNIFRRALDYELETPIRIDVVENVEILLNYLEGFASHSETYGIYFGVSIKGINNVHDNIMAFGTLSNFASGSYLSYETTTSPTINYHHNTFYSLAADVNGAIDEVTNTFTDNLSFQCVYYDETGTNNFIGNPTFLSGNPVKQIESSVPTVHDFNTYYTQLINPFKLASGSSAEGYGFRFDYAGAVNPISKNEINIFPNPASKYFTINSSERILRVSIYNQTGQKVIENSEFNGNINISNLSNGVYFVMTQSDKGITTKKIIINN